MAHFQDGFIGRLQWNCTLKETEALSLCTDSHLPPALLSLCQMVERRFFYKVTWLPLFLYGAGVTLPSDPISGDSRKMDGARDLGMYSFVVVCVCASFFFSPDVGTFPQGLGEIVLTTQWSVLLEPSVITKPEFTPVRHIVTITSLAQSSLSLTRKNKPPKLGWN